MSRVLFILLLMIFFNGCGETTTADGSGLGTGNPSVAVVGAAYHSNGEPVVGAQVQVRNQFTTESSNFPYLGPEFDTNGFVYTDSSGKYDFTLVDTGYFRIEIRDGDSGISYEFVLDTFGDSKVITDLMLHPIDTIKGYITLGGQALANAHIYIAYSNDFSVLSASDGFFRMPILSGQFRLIIQSDEIIPNKSYITDFYGAASSLDSIVIPDTN